VGYPLPEPPDSRLIIPRSYARALKDIGLASDTLAAHLADDPVREFLLELERREGSQWTDGVEPMPLDEWCVLLDDKPLTTRQRWVFEYCNVMRAGDVFSHRRKAQELVLAWGKGAGKGYTIAKLFSWLCYVLCSMSGYPAERFGLARESKLVMLNVAPNEDLAKNVFFHYLKGFLKHPFIQRYKPTMTTEDVRFFREGRWAPYEFLSVYSRHSNASGLDGHNLIAGAGDEIDDFVRTETECRATKIHQIMRSSAETRVGRNWLIASFSYPRTEDGFLMKRRAEALENMEEFGPDATMFTDLAASWVVRPDIDMNSPNVRADYKNDPRAAAAKYECLPMPATDAFFEFEEKIAAAVNPAKAPCASWREVMGEIRTRGGMTPCIRVELGDVRPEPGRRYYLAGDGGITGDAFSVVVWSVPSEGWVDTSSPSATGNQSGASDIHWLCPRCVLEEPYLLEDHPYRQLEQGTQWHAEHEDEIPICGGCSASASMAMRGNNQATFYTSGWWRAGVPAGKNAERYEDRSEDAPIAFGDDAPATGTLVVDGREIVVPRVREELIITWSPRLRRRPGDKIVTVDLVNVEAVIGELIERLFIKRASFDPYQMAAIAQRLQGRAGCLVETVSFSREEQYKRGRTAKALLYSHLIEFIPHRLPEPGDGASYDFRTGEIGHTGEARRDAEWRKLQRKGKALDHPPGGSKDILDAEFVAINAAVSDWMGKIEIGWSD
jgi:hypothetical protein